MHSSSGSHTSSRNSQKTQAAVDALKTETNHQAILGMQLDLGSQKSIRAFAADYLAADLPPLYALVCNAGLSPMSNSVTADGNPWSLP